MAISGYEDIEHEGTPVTGDTDGDTNLGDTEENTGLGDTEQEGNENDDNKPTEVPTTALKDPVDILTEDLPELLMDIKEDAKVLAEKMDAFKEKYVSVARLSTDIHAKVKLMLQTGFSTTDPQSETQKQADWLVDAIRKERYLNRAKASMDIVSRVLSSNGTAILIHQLKEAADEAVTKLVDEDVMPIDNDANKDAK